MIALDAPVLVGRVYALDLLCSLLRQSHWTHLCWSVACAPWICFSLNYADRIGRTCVGRLRVPRPIVFLYLLCS
jgi:hypothetical protein